MLIELVEAGGKGGADQQHGCAAGLLIDGHPGDEHQRLCLWVQQLRLSVEHSEASI
jgi:hypothetical protein